MGTQNNNRCRTILGTQKGTIILTTTHMQAKDVNPGLGSFIKDLGFKDFLVCYRQGALTIGKGVLAL